MKVEMFKGSDGWRWRLVARNGEIVSQSECYASKFSCKRTARKLAKLLESEVVQV